MSHALKCSWTDSAKSWRIGAGATTGCLFVAGLSSLPQLPGLAQVAVAIGARDLGFLALQGNPRAFGVASFPKGNVSPPAVFRKLEFPGECIDSVGCACSKSCRRGLLVGRGSQSAEGLSLAAVWVSVCMPPSRFVCHESAASPQSNMLDTATRVSRTDARWAPAYSRLLTHS